MHVADMRRMRWLVIAVVIGGCTDRYHPDNFGAGPVHGPALKTQSEDCRACHGEDLAGGTANVSCDGCHSGPTPTAWRQNCTFCHGGMDNDTGAPPRNIDGTDLVGPFPAHSTHVTGSAIANAYDCTQCHVKANDVLSPGHVFDATPGAGENDYGAGLSPQARFNREDGSCSNVYCHGSGRGDDGVAVRGASLSCAGCHPAQDSGGAGWAKMSGPHALHMAAGTGMTCADCHSSTTTDGATITAKDLHINGRRDVAITAANFQYEAARASCTGSCHGYSHSNRPWVGGADGRYHPAGFSAPSAHGPELELQRLDCRGCHGATLTGGGSGLSGPSCDGCHPGATPTAWRTNCVFCHGGGIDQSGAPPRDLGSSIVNASQSFVAHSRHVTPTMMRTNDCTTCHKKPVDVMSMDHAFDATPQTAEVNLTLDGRNPGATYSFTTGTCSNLYCHGNGRTNGSYTDGFASLTCISCHGGRANNFANLSANHKDHHDGLQCAECHRSVVATGSTAITNAALHVNKQRDVMLVTGTFTAATRTCTNLACHGTETW